MENLEGVIEKVMEDVEVYVRAAMLTAFIAGGFDFAKFENEETEADEQAAYNDGYDNGYEDGYSDGAADSEEVLPAVYEVE